MNKTDMSSKCEKKYGEYWAAANYYKTLSQKDWLKWYSNIVPNASIWLKCVSVERNELIFERN